MSEYTLGIDLNRYRPGFDIAKVKDAGGRFVIGKATEINANNVQKWEDPTYKPYRDATKDNELPWGAFMYWKAAEDPEEQVDWFFEIVKKHIDLPPIIDVERTNNIGILSQADAEQSVYECAQLLTSIYNIEPLLYTNWWSWFSLCGNGELAGELPLWVANHTNYHTPLLPEPATEWDLWQFTSAYPWPGQPKTADANRFNGDQATFDEYVKVSRSIMYPDEPPPDGNGNGDELGIVINLDGVQYEGQVRIV